MRALAALALVIVYAFGACVAPVVSQCDECMGGMAMPGCPYPELCGVLPALSCLNCSTSASAGCPHPEWCVDVKCGSSCMDGMPMPGCSDPGACGFTPIPCVGCIAGNSTAGQHSPASLPGTATLTAEMPLLNRALFHMLCCCVCGRLSRSVRVRSVQLDRLLFAQLASVLALCGRPVVSGLPGA